MDEGFGSGTTTFHSTVTKHRLVIPGEKSPNRALAGVSDAGISLASFRCRDVYVVSWMEHLRITAEVNFIIIKGKLAAGSEPRVMRQRGASTMIGMGVDRPLREENIGPEVDHKSGEFRIAG